ncbi:MAG: DUF4912 domain-containing protein [Planctomycetia bacterium]|nr:DUF4912 domain-containing protein [Planctomycetia bacterium]
MPSIADMKKMTIQQLTPLAKKYGITRLHSMRKCDLVDRIVEKMTERDPSFRNATRSFGTDRHASEGAFFASQATGGSTFATGPTVPFRGADNSAASVSSFRKSRRMDLAYCPDAADDIEEESLDVAVIDPYWLHVTWAIRRKTIERAKAAMGQLWYDAKPILRVTLLSDGDAGTGVRFQHDRDIFVHGFVNHWFIPVTNPPATYQIEIGYLAGQRFHALLKGNVISTPQVRRVLRYEKSTESSWMTACELKPASIPDWSPSNHNLSRKWTSKTNALFSVEDTGEAKTFADYPLRVETEIVVYGSTVPDSRVTVNDEWVAVQPDGTFMLRLDIPEQGQQMVIDSIHRDESRKIILKLDRSTQLIKPQKLDGAKKKKSSKN